jgi:hypothetical protein
VRGRHHSPLLDIGVHTLSLGLDVDDRLVLLLDEHGHLLEHLRKLGDGLLDFLDLDVSVLDFTEGPTRRAVSVGVEQLTAGGNRVSRRVAVRGDTGGLSRSTLDALLTAWEKTCGLSLSTTALTSSSDASGLTILYCLSALSLTFFLNSFSITWCSFSSEVKRVLTASTWVFIALSPLASLNSFLMLFLHCSRSVRAWSFSWSTYAAA